MKGKRETYQLGNQQKLLPANFIVIISVQLLEALMNPTELLFRDCHHSFVSRRTFVHD